MEGPIYRSGKAALNMLCAHYAVKFGGEGWKVNAVCPGFVATKLNGFSGTATAASAAGQVVRMAMVGENGPSGTFAEAKGSIPW